MTRYLVSVSEDELRQHPEYNAFTAMLGDPVIWKHRYTLDNPACYIGQGEDSHHYFVSTGDELDDVTERLLSGVEKGSVRIQRLNSKDDFPPNLREMYEKFFEALVSV